MKLTIDTDVVRLWIRAVEAGCKTCGRMDCWRCSAGDAMDGMQDAITQATGEDATVDTRSRQGRGCAGSGVAV